MAGRNQGFLLKRALLCSALLLCFAALSYVYVDRAVVQWLHDHHSRDYELFDIMARGLVDVTRFAVPVYFMVFAVCFYWSKPRVWMRHLLTVCCAAVLAYAIDHSLKSVFARTWAATFVCDNDSWLRDGVYGFYWFKSGIAYGSFSSGHSACAAAAACVIAMLYPKCRVLCLVLLLTVMFGQVLMYYHFVSDVLVGMLVGLWTARVCVDLTNASHPN